MRDAARAGEPRRQLGARPAWLPRPADRPRHRAPARRRERSRALARRLRADPRVRRRASAERRAHPRFLPDDPALARREAAPGTVPGTPVQWWAARSGFQRAWDSRARRRTRWSPSSTPASTRPIPSWPAASPAPRASTPSARRPPSTRSATARTSPRSPAAAGNNGVGLVGAGLRCRLLVVKTSFSDSSVAAAIVVGRRPRRRRDQPELRQPAGRAALAAPCVDAIDYAAQRGVVLVAAAADDPIEEQGDPANLAAADGHRARPDREPRAVGHRRRRLRRRARELRGPRPADLASPPTAPTPSSRAAARAGIFGAFPGAQRARARRRGQPAAPPCALPDDVRRRRALRLPAGHVDGDAPMVAGAAALVRDLNPDLRAPEIVRAAQGDARAARRAPAGRPSSAGASSTRAPRSSSRASMDRRAPTLAGGGPAGAHERSAGHGALATARTARRAACAAPAWRATSCTCAVDGGPRAARADHGPDGTALRRARPAGATRLHERRRRPRGQPRAAAAPRGRDDQRGVSAGVSSVGAPLPAARSAARGPCARRLLAGQRQQLGQRRLDPVGDGVEVGHRVVVAEQAEVHLAVVGHDRDGQRVVLAAGTRRGRRPAARARARTAGTAGPGTLVTIRLNRRVEKFSREAWAEDRRRGEVLDAGQHLGADAPAWTP